MFVKLFVKFVLVLNKLFDVRWKLLKELAKIMFNVPLTFDHHWSFSRKKGRT